MAKHEKIVIRDLLYLDFEKAASIWSQFDEGLLQSESITLETEKSGAAGAKVGIPGLAEANLGADYLHKRATLQSRTLHHNILNRVESRLAEVGLVADLSEEMSANESSPEKVRATIGDRPYVRASGPSVLEDYNRVLAITEQFNKMAEFIARSGQEAVKKTPAYQELEADLSALRKAIGSIPDRNQKAIQKNRLKTLEDTVQEMTKPSLAGVDQWVLDGVQLWVRTFMSSRINFRIYPFSNCPSFQVLCNLKRECFVDDDLEHLLFGYGNRPNVSMAVFGLITSMPSSEPNAFDPMQEFADSPSLSEKAGFEKGFRSMFGAMEEMEGFVRYSRYPNITVHPIAVYRSFLRPSSAD
jgi:hypothetical protein